MTAVEITGVLLARLHPDHTGAEIVFPVSLTTDEVAAIRQLRASAQARELLSDSAWHRQVLARGGDPTEEAPPLPGTPGLLWWRAESYVERDTFIVAVAEALGVIAKVDEHSASDIDVLFWIDRDRAVDLGWAASANDTCESWAEVAH